jgi:hypothetical protein
MTKRGANAAISYMSCAGINQLSNNLQRSVFSLSFFFKFFVIRFV